MIKLIALLRGINVSGQKSIKMKDLQKLFEKAGFEEVETYIQSGNVIFLSKEKNREKVSEIIRKAINKKYGFDVEVWVLTPEYMKSVVKKNPYAKTKDFDGKRLYVSFLSEIPAKDKLQLLSEVNSGDDSFVFTDKHIYFYCPGGYGKSKLSNTTVENKLKLKATTRNWNTVCSLAE